MKRPPTGHLLPALAALLSLASAPGRPAVEASILTGKALTGSGPTEMGPNELIGYWRNQIMSHLQEHLLNKIQLNGDIKDVFGRVRERHNEAKSAPDYATLDQLDKRRIFLTIVSEELKAKRAELRARRGAGSSRKEKAEEAKAVEKVLRNVPKELISDESWDPDKQLLVGEEEGGELENELNNFRNRDEPEMGWSMSEDVQQRIKQRTVDLLQDIVMNEVKQLALGLLAIAIDGGKPMDLVLKFLNGNLRMKLLKYIMDVISDVLLTDESYRQSGVSEVAAGGASTMEVEARQREERRRTKDMASFLATMID